MEWITVIIRIVYTVRALRTGDPCYSPTGLAFTFTVAIALTNTTTISTTMEWITGIIRIVYTGRALRAGDPCNSTTGMAFTFTIARYTLASYATVGSPCTGKMAGHIALTNTTTISTTMEWITGIIRIVYTVRALRARDPCNSTTGLAFTFTIAWAGSDFPSTSSALPWETSSCIASKRTIAAVDGRQAQWRTAGTGARTVRYTLASYAITLGSPGTGIMAGHWTLGRRHTPVTITQQSRKTKTSTHANIRAYPRDRLVASWWTESTTVAECFISSTLAAEVSTT